jgi:DNA repair exonuclease SbcCD ATPase subunit
MQLLTMKCPKCGHSQEERQDCLRCGIVFAKYYAMYPQGTDLPMEGQEKMVASYAVPADTLSAEVSELRQGVREIASRLSDVEFDHAERSLLRGEVKTVEQRVTELVEDLRNRMLALEERTSGLEQAEARPEPPGITIEEVAGRLAQMDEQLDRLVSQPPSQDPVTAETIRKVAMRQSGLEDRIDKLVAGLQLGAEAGQPAERALEELRQAVQTATVRYSEIGELKKNHLVLQNEVETLRRDQEVLLSRPANGTAARLAQLESEVAALRAELRQALKRLESMESGLALQMQEVRSPASGEADAKGLSSALAQLDASIKEDRAAWAKQNEFFSSELRRFEDWNQSMSTGLQETSDGLKESCRRMEGLLSDVSVLKQDSTQLRARLQALQDRPQKPVQARAANQPPKVEGELHAIREGLDQIRAFMQTLAQKP